jgi:hypothetical protein
LPAGIEALDSVLGMRKAAYPPSFSDAPSIIGAGCPIPENGGPCAKNKKRRKIVPVFSPQVRRLSIMDKVPARSKTHASRSQVFNLIYSNHTKKSARDRKRLFGR